MPPKLQPGKKHKRKNKKKQKDVSSARESGLSSATADRGGTPTITLSSQSAQPSSATSSTPAPTVSKPLPKAPPQTPSAGTTVGQGLVKAYHAQQSQRTEAPAFAYSRELTDADRKELDGLSLPVKEEGNSASGLIVLESGSRYPIDKMSTRDGSSEHEGSTYWKGAWSGHKNDAEIKLLHRVDKLKLDPNARGTIYLLTTSGPCDSCKEALNAFRTSHPGLQIKLIYLNDPEENRTQDTPIKYGWQGDKKIFRDRYYYHYLPAQGDPDKDKVPLTAKDEQSLAFAMSLYERQLKNGKDPAAALATTLSMASLPKKLELELKKRLVQEGSKG